MEWEADIGAKEERSREWGRSRKRARGRLQKRGCRTERERGIVME